MAGAGGVYRNRKIITARALASVGLSRSYVMTRGADNIEKAMPGIFDEAAKNQEKMKADQVARIAKKKAKSQPQQTSLFAVPKPVKDTPVVHQKVELSARDKAIAAQVQKESGFGKTSKAYIADTLIKEAGSLVERKPLTVNGVKLERPVLNQLLEVQDSENSGHPVTYFKYEHKYKGDLLRKADLIDEDSRGFFVTNEGKDFIKTHLHPDRKIVIDVPGGATYTIPHTPYAIDNFMQRVGLQPEKLSETAKGVNKFDPNHKEDNQPIQQGLKAPMFKKAVEYVNMPVTENRKPGEKIQFKTERVIGASYKDFIFGKGEHDTHPTLTHKPSGLAITKGLVSRVFENVGFPSNEANKLVDARVLKIVAGRLQESNLMPKTLAGKLSKARGNKLRAIIEGVGRELKNQG